MLSPVQHLFDGGKLILGEHLPFEKLRRELYGDLADILRAALALLPDMFKVSCTYQHKIIFPDLLDTIPYYAAAPGTMLDEVEFILLMLVKRVRKLGLVALHHIKTVLFGQSGNLCEYLAHLPCVILYAKI